MADKVLPQRVSATSVRVGGAELLEGGGLSMLPSQGRGVMRSPWGGGSHWAASCLLGTGAKPARESLSLPLGWWERFGVCISWPDRTVSEQGAAEVWSGDPRRTLSLLTIRGCVICL